MILFVVRVFNFNLFSVTQLETKVKRVFAGFLTEEQRDGVSSKVAPNTSHCQINK